MSFVERNSRGGYVAGVGNFNPAGDIYLSHLDKLYLDWGEASGDDTYITSPSNSRIDLYTSGATQFSVRSDINYSYNPLYPSADDSVDLGAAAVRWQDLFISNSIDLEETTTPTGVADSAILYAEDNGAGKTKLMVIFGTGAAQQIAIEP